MSKLSKATLARLQSAFAYAQKRLRTSYHFTFQGMTAKEAEERSGSPNAIMVIEHTERGNDDPTHFLVTANQSMISTRSMGTLRIDAGHEVIHAILYQMHLKNTYGNMESATYILQRALFGDRDE